jgi:sugar phosphate isomerase/epimerase
LALTFGFRSLEIDLDAFIRKAQTQGIEHAARFLVSAQLKLGCFELPIEWRGAEEEYQSELKKLDLIGKLAAAAGGTVCHTAVVPGSNALPYHDNFELHRKRLTEIGEKLDEHGVKLGLTLRPLPAERANHEFQFIFEAEALVALLKSITSQNVGVFLDTWTWYFGGGTTEHLDTLGSHQVVGLVVSDAPEGLDTITVSESQRVLPGGESEVIDVVDIIRRLHEKGVRGPVTLATGPDTFSGQAREATVQQATQLLDKLLTDAGAIVSKASPALSP